MGRLNFQITNAYGQTSVTSFLAPSPTAKVNSTVLQMYQSFIAPPALTPGLFSKFTNTSFTLPVTYGSSWNVLNVISGKWGG